MKAILTINSGSSSLKASLFLPDGGRRDLGYGHIGQGGIDALVFSGGIGEHSPQVRALICEPLAFLGIGLDPSANLAHKTVLSAASSKPVLLIPADEEGMIRELTEMTVAAL